MKNHFRKIYQTSIVLLTMGITGKAAESQAHEKCLQTAEAGEICTSDTIACDPLVIKGRLDNGLTYYIRHNANPAGCADFYIVHNVGALQEEDSQNGLAHFLEHMAFNGTKHFPDKGILEFLAREGVRFGHNVNAYTTRTETVYNLSSVPLVRESFVDSVLLVLHDWSGEISCDQDAIDAERGVIREEWRRRDNSKTRMFESQSALIYSGAKQAERNVIGSLEVIDGFDRHEILDFYHKWYRPDLQAVIIVGDFDAAEMEKKVIDRFSGIPAAANPAPKEECHIPALDNPIFTHVTDPDIRFIAFKAMHRQPYPSVEVRRTEGFIKDRLIRSIITEAFSARLGEAVKAADCPVKRAVLVTYPSGTDFYVSQFTLLPKDEDGLDEVIRFYRNETERFLRYGISEEEFENARFKVFKKEHLGMPVFKQNVTDKQLVSSYVANFLTGMPYVHPAEMQELTGEILSGIKYGEIPSYIGRMFADSEKIYFCNSRTGEENRLPAVERMEELLLSPLPSVPEPHFLDFDDIDTSAAVTPGAIVKISRKKDGETWTLSNGARVCWTPSAPVKAYRHLDAVLEFGTGYGVFPSGQEKMSKIALSYISRNAGFRDSDFADVRNSPACFGANVSFRASQEHGYVLMNSDSAHVENGFRQLYLHLTEPYFSDCAKLEDFKAGSIDNIRKADPDKRRFNQAMRDARYGGHPWMETADSGDFRALDMAFIKETFRREYTDFSNMTAYIASDLDKETVMKLVCRYLASLDNGSSSPKSGIRPAEACYKGNVIIDSTYSLKTVPKSSVEISFRGKAAMSPANMAAFDIVDYIMSARCLDKIREERGGTYSISFSTEFSPEDRGRYESSVAFETRPELSEMLISDILAELEAMAASGPTTEEMDNAGKYLVKARNEKAKARENSLSSRNRDRMTIAESGFDPNFDYGSAVGKVSSRDIKKLAKKILRGDRMTVIYSED